ncbi:MAG: tripartite tricarboxylate transporter permease [Halobacteriales archaeon]
MIEVSAAVALGVALGTFSGLVPGVHVNNFALALAAAAPAFAGVVEPVVLGVVFVSSAVTHTYVDALPSFALGVPDDSMALAALPGHRLVLNGRGREAVALSVVGSSLGLGFALAGALPLSAVMSRLYPSVAGGMAWVLVAVVVYLLATERGTEVGVPGRSLDGWRALRVRAVALYVLVASGVIGAYVLRGSGSEDGLLMPLFVGLFAMPLLAASAAEDAGLPRQDDDVIRLRRRDVLFSAAGGGFAGSLVGWLPGMSPAVATSAVQSALPRSESEADSMRSFVVGVSAVDTANAVYAALALYYIGRPRSGVMVAFDELDVALSSDVLALLVGALAVAAVAAHLVTLWLAGPVFEFARRVDYRWLSIGVACFLVALTYALTGAVGVGVLAAATLVGLVPNYTGVRRVNCMGCLLLPLIAFYL